MNEPFWYSDPSILFSQTSWFKFVPTADMPVSTALNSVVRFSVYLSLLLFVSTMRPIYLLIIPLVMIVTIALDRVFQMHERLLKGLEMDLLCLDMLETWRPVLQMTIRL